MAWIRMGGSGTKLKEWCNLVIGLANVPIREDVGFFKSVWSSVDLLYTFESKGKCKLIGYVGVNGSLSQRISIYLNDTLLYDFTTPSNQNTGLWGKELSFDVNVGDVLKLVSTSNLKYSGTLMVE